MEGSFSSIDSPGVSPFSSLGFHAISLVAFPVVVRKGFTFCSSGDVDMREHWWTGVCVRV